MTGELTPPRDFDATALLRTARSWEGSLDAVHVNDCLLSTARMSNLAVAGLLRDTTLEPVLQVTLRHRNRIAVQADLLGARALSVQGLLLLAGYDLSVGCDPRAREARDLQSGEALALSRRLADTGALFDGEMLAKAPRFDIGAVAFVASGSPLAQLRQIEAKIARGAQWLQMQGAFDPEVAVSWLDTMAAEGVHERVRLVGGVIPFRSYERLRVLDSTPGLSVPSCAWERMRVHDTEEEGLAFATEVALTLHAHPATSGVHIRPFGWDEAVPVLAASIRDSDNADARPRLRS